MKFLKWLGIIIGVIILGLVIAGIVMNESLPEGGTEGEQADKMALKMENALGKEHWHDIQYMEWTFAGMHHFLWDKHRNMVRVKWGENSVFIKPGTSDGKAFTGVDKHVAENSAELIKTANDYFNNDMFWLVAPFKTFDEGVTRKTVDYEGEKRLLVTYSSGGSSPGDSYLWKLAEDGTPESYKMWAQIIPIGGVETSWENWYTFGNGTRISHLHKGGPLNLVVSNVAAGYNFEELEYAKDPFSLLLKK